MRNKDISSKRGLGKCYEKVTKTFLVREDQENVMRELERHFQYEKIKKCYERVRKTYLVRED